MCPHIKNPSKLQNEVRGKSRHSNVVRRTPFFIRRACAAYAA
ncbi:hypothetical protein CLOSTMETH_03860 [[Clostridium] methylpentosum DSM 5476]|uniref:Uncharacterized protein n=1 Tax=[Clostridium] methylpentosum DSM 5476 TaxID=537013 RepID=C0EJ13_9FIRM|nr:hypothetical protein CLOSTMETH_03860 [[Clostridium] methylpentosum DSM 5476]